MGERIRRVAVVSAGMSVPSSTRLLADLLGEQVVTAVAARGDEVEVTHVELRPLAHALADNLLTGFPADDLATAIDTVTGADALVVVTPVFSGSFSGLFKTFFDVLPMGSVDGKPILIGATAGTARHSLVLDHALRPLFAYLRGLVVPTGVFAASEDFGGASGLDGGLRKRGERAATELAALLGCSGSVAVPARRTPAPDEEFVNPTPFEQLLREAGGDTVR